MNEKKIDLLKRVSNQIFKIGFEATSKNTVELYNSVYCILELNELIDDLLNSENESSLKSIIDTLEAFEKEVK